MMRLVSVYPVKADPLKASYLDFAVCVAGQIEDQHPGGGILSGEVELFFSTQCYTYSLYSYVKDFFMSQYSSIRSIHFILEWQHLGCSFPRLDVLQA